MGGVMGLDTTQPPQLQFKSKLHENCKQHDKHTKTKQKGPEKYKNAQIIPACIVRFLTFDI